MEADSPEPEVPTIASAAMKGAIVGLLIGLPLSALLLKSSASEATPAQILVLWPVIVATVSAGFSVRAYSTSDPQTRRWTNLDAGAFQRIAAWSLFASPLAWPLVVGLALAVDTYNPQGGPISPFTMALALVASGFAALSPVMGVLLFPKDEWNSRLLMTVLLCLFGFIAYWIVLSIILTVGRAPYVLSGIGG